MGGGVRPHSWLLPLLDAPPPWAFSRGVGQAPGTQPPCLVLAILWAVMRAVLAILWAVLLAVLTPTPGAVLHKKAACHGGSCGFRVQMAGG